MKQDDKTKLLNLARAALTDALTNMEPARAVQYAQVVATLDVLPVDPDTTPETRAARCGGGVHIATIGAAVCECGAKQYSAAKVAEYMRTADETPFRARIAPTPVPAGMPIQAPNPTAPCMHSVYGKGTCLLQWGHNTDHDFDGESKTASAGGPVQGVTFAKPVSEARANAAMDALSKPMLLDGPVPTFAQVARIRNEALEEAARRTDLAAKHAHSEVVKGSLMTAGELVRELKTAESK